MVVNIIVEVVNVNILLFVIMKKINIWNKIKEIEVKREKRREKRRRRRGKGEGEIEKERRRKGINE